jgi:hypothetical protein
MAVNLSFIGGAGWQFFDNNGVPLAGGKLYTYAAGTTTPQATFTSRTGVTQNANPIILDSAGRTPEQIWSTEGLLYKYVVETADNVLIRSWDNIGGSVVASDLAQDLAAPSGSSLVGFLQSGVSATPTTVETKLRETVSVKDFGAAGDGVTDDTAAIRAAATAANAKGIPLLVNPGTYFIDSPGDIELRVSLDATGAVFKLGANMGLTPVFIARGNPLDDITSSVVLTQITKNVTTVASLAPYRNGFIRIRSNVPNLTRTPGSAMLFKEECGYISKEGVLVTPIRHNYSTGGTGITQVQYRKDETAQLIVYGGAVDVNGKFSPRFLTVERNDVKVKNWTVLDSTNSAKIDQAFIFRISNCANFVMEDISGDAMNQAVSASFSYLVDIVYAFNSRFSRCFIQGGWGSLTGNGANGYHITDSNFDRFDIHYDGYDMTVDNCTFYQNILYGSGGGVLQVTNSTKIAKQVQPFLSNTSVVASVVASRGDYGGTWDGNVLINNVTVVVSDSYTISTTNPIVFYSGGAVGDFGAGRALPDPHTIVLQNCLVNASDATLSNNSFSSIGVRLSGERTFSGNPGTIPPNRIIVDNLAVSNPYARALGAGQILALTTVNNYNAAIIAGRATPRVVRALGTMDSERGVNSVDLQPVTVSRTSVASGELAVISGGDSNQANGARSYVPGGAYATTRNRAGSWAFSSNVANLGRYQAAGIVLQTRTTDATPLRMVSDAPGTTPSALNQLSFPANIGAVFQGIVVARSSGAEIKGWKVEGVVRNTAGNFSLVAPAVVSVIAENAGATTWVLNVIADDTLDCVAFNVTGQAAKTIDWVARIDVIEAGN